MISWGQAGQKGAGAIAYNGTNAQGQPTFEYSVNGGSFPAQLGTLFGTSNGCVGNACDYFFIPGYATGSNSVTQVPTPVTQPPSSGTGDPTNNGTFLAPMDPNGPVISVNPSPVTTPIPDPLPPAAQPVQTPAPPNYATLPPDLIVPTPPHTTLPPKLGPRIPINRLPPVAATPPVTSVKPRFGVPFRPGDKTTTLSPPGTAQGANGVTTTTPRGMTATSIPGAQSVNGSGSSPSAAMKAVSTPAQTNANETANTGGMNYSDVAPPTYANIDASAKGVSSQTGGWVNKGVVLGPVGNYANPNNSYVTVQVDRTDPVNGGHYTFTFYNDGTYSYSVTSWNYAISYTSPRMPGDGTVSTADWGIPLITAAATPPAPTPPAPTPPAPTPPAPTATAVTPPAPSPPAPLPSAATTPPPTPPAAAPPPAPPNPDGAVTPAPTPPQLPPPDSSFYTPDKFPGILPSLAEMDAAYQEGHANTSNPGNDPTPDPGSQSGDNANADSRGPSSTFTTSGTQSVMTTSQGAGIVIGVTAAVVAISTGVVVVGIVGAGIEIALGLDVRMP